MDKKSVILVFMIIVTIIIIVVSTVLLLFINMQKNTINNNKNELITFLTEKVRRVENRDQFFNIGNHIKKYMDYRKQNDTQAIQAISKEEVINIDNFQAKEMYLLNKITNYTVYVYGVTKQANVQNDYYMVVNLDYTNYTFSISASSKQEFENAKNNMVKGQYKEDIVIQKNKYNDIVLGETVDDFEVLKIYFDDYKFKAIYYPEEAFELIDVTYKKEKFNNDLEQFKAYIQNNRNTLQDANIVKHGVTKENGITKYIFVDNYNQYYELKETGIYQYTIILDNYTVQSNEQLQKYNRLTNEEKALSNIDKVMKLIDEKDYNTIYNYLNQDFKNTNFPTIESFTKYMKETFFENNIVGRIEVKQEGNIFILNVPYKESLSTAAEDMEKTFMMKLTEGMNFELSFEI